MIVSLRLKKDLYKRKFGSKVESAPISLWNCSFVIIDV